VKSAASLIRVTVLVIVLLACGVIAALLFAQTQTAVNDLSGQLQNLDSMNRLDERVDNLSGESAAQEANRLPGVAPPTSAQDVFFARFGTVTPIYWLRFSDSPDAVEAFVAALCPDTALTDSYAPAFLSDDEFALIPLLDWWTPPTADSRLGAGCDLRPSVRVELLVDRSAAQTWTLYAQIATNR
jgi:hypothetical protein